MEELQKITSLDNQRLIGARRIRDGHGTGKMFVEGKRLAAEALRSGVEIWECFVSEKFVESSENAELLETASAIARFTFELPDRIFNTIADTEHPQGIVLIAERPVGSSERIETALARPDLLPVVLLLFQINNPSNLGAILRTSEAAGVAGVIVTKESADVYSPKSLRASMGSAFRIPIWNEVSIEFALRWAKSRQIDATATTTEGNESYSALDWKKQRLLVFGSEAHGLSRNELEQVDQKIKIPMAASVESLNLAVAAGIILFEAKRQNLSD